MNPRGRRLLRDLDTLIIGLYVVIGVVALSIGTSPWLGLLSALPLASAVWRVLTARHEQHAPVPPTALRLTNESAELLGVYVEPHPSDYWLRAGEALLLVGVPGSLDVDVTRFDGGLTVCFGEDLDPGAWALDGVRLVNGHQRPDQ